MNREAWLWLFLVVAWSLMAVGAAAVFYLCGVQREAACLLGVIAALFIYYVGCRLSHYYEES